MSEGRKKDLKATLHKNRGISGRKCVRKPCTNLHGGVNAVEAEALHSRGGGVHGAVPVVHVRPDRLGHCGDDMPYAFEECSA